MAELMVSIKRLQTFMMYEELDRANTKPEGKQETSEDEVKKNYDVNNGEKKANDKVDTNNYQGEHILSLNNASAKWLSYEQENTLKNINIKVKPGELVAIVGQVGSGKSSLLNVILKELPINSGAVHVRIASRVITYPRLRN